MQHSTEVATYLSAFGLTEDIPKHASTDTMIMLRCPNGRGIVILNCC